MTVSTIISMTVKSSHSALSSDKTTKEEQDTKTRRRVLVQGVLLAGALAALAIFCESLNFGKCQQELMGNAHVFLGKDGMPTGNEAVVSCGGKGCSRIESFPETAETFETQAGLFSRGRSRSKARNSRSSRDARNYSRGKRRSGFPRSSRREREEEDYSQDSENSNSGENINSGDLWNYGQLFLRILAFLGLANLFLWLTYDISIFGCQNTICSSCTTNCRSGYFTEFICGEFCCCFNGSAAQSSY